MNDALFPFGYGLSYTSFSIGKAELNSRSINKTQTLTMTIPVANTGRREGTEVVQVYVRKVGDKDGPLKTLKAFKRVGLAPGKSGNVVVSLPPTAFEFFDAGVGKMTVSSGEYEMFYGNSSLPEDLRSEIISIQ